MRTRPAHPTRLAAIIAGLALTVAACADGDIEPLGNDDPTPAEQPDEPDVDPADAAAEAYETFIAAVDDAFAAGDPDHPDLLEAAADDALVSIRSQITTMVDDGHTLAGQREPSVEDIEASRGRAELVDCQLNGTAIGDGVDADDSPGGRELQGGALEQRDGTWVVVDYGPQLVGGPQSCAPADIAADVEQVAEQVVWAEYEAFTSEDIDLDPLADLLTDDRFEHVSNLRDAVVAQGVRYERLPEMDAERYETTTVTEFDTVAVVERCWRVAEPVHLVDVDTGEQGAESLSEGNRGADIVLHRDDDGTWRVHHEEFFDEGEREQRCGDL